MTDLFDNERAANLASAIELIERTLVELGHRVADARVDRPDDLDGALRAWRVTRGSARVDVALIDRPDGVHLRVAAAILTLDGAVDRAALFERLLRLNSAPLIGAGFALRGDQVVLAGQRSTRDLDHSEVRELIDRVLGDADRYDDELVAEFGGRRG